MASSNTRVLVEDLRCEYAHDPLGVDTLFPRLSWRMVDPLVRRGQRQTAAEILVASSAARLERGEGDLWEMRLETEQSLHVVYQGAPFCAYSECYWKVRVWDSNGVPSEWSKPARFSVGPLRAEDWGGEWIGMASASPKECPWLRKNFTLDERCDTAFAHVASVGYHELYVNGQKVGDAVLSPSVSNLAKRVLYSSYDIAPYLVQGENTLGLWLAAGWAEHMPSDGWPTFDLPKFPLAKAQLELRTAERRRSIVSDTSFKYRASSLKHGGGWHGTDFGGECVDLRAHVPNWASPEFCADDWEPAAVYALTRELSRDIAPPNRRLEVILPANARAVEGGTCITMAHVFTGFIEVKLRGTPGSTATISFSMDEAKACQFNQQGTLTFDERGEGIFSNRFSYHGIQYVTILGATGTLSLDDIRGYRVGNDLERTGAFDCSNPLLKRIYDVTLNTFINLTTGGYPADCAHREKLGYGGDGMTTLEVALANYEMGPLYTKWALDWVNCQRADGKLPNTAPVAGGGGSPAYGCFIITLPWQVYLTYGDVRILERTYPAMQAWVAYLDTCDDEESLLLPFEGDWHFLGDWLSPAGEGGEEGRLFYNNVHRLYATRILVDVAARLGRAEDSQIYREKSDAIEAVIHRRFFDAETAIYLDTKQVNLVLPLISGAVPKEREAAVFRKLEAAIQKEGKLDTGLFGTYFLTKYLTQMARSDLLYTIATAKDYPSYAHILAAGYDTWPEDWKMEHRFGVSKVHGCLNGIGAWFQAGLAGIMLNPEHPGYQQFLVRPQLVGDLTWVKGEVSSMYGKMVSTWEVTPERFTLWLEIPPNTRASVFYPCADLAKIHEADTLATEAQGVKVDRVQADCTVFDVGSGVYVFSHQK